MTYVSSKIDDLKPYSLLFQAIANPTRLKILYSLYLNGSMSVNEIVNELKLEQTRVSHNLKCLSHCGLVFAERKGKSKIYSVNKETITPIINVAQSHVQKFANNLLSCDSLVR